MMPIPRPAVLAMAALSLAAAARAGVVQGVVVENRSGKPLARASVTIEVVKGAVDGPTTVLTDANGSFRFPAVRAGSYRVSARRRGFVTAHFGQRRYDQPATPVVVEGEGVFTAELRLARPGAVSGTVSDENGVGMPEMQVYAYRAGDRLQMARSASTDDRGRYRLGGLEPGKYLISTAARVLEDGRTLLPTYLGQTAARAQARTVEVALEQELADADIQPLPGKLGVIKGMVAGAGVREVRLVTDAGVREAQVGIGGSWSFPELPPGRYDVLAEAGAGDPAISAARRVDLTGGEVFVMLEAGASPQVKLACRDAKGENVPGDPVSLFLDRPLVSSDAEIRVTCGSTVRISAGAWKIRLLAVSGVYVERVLEARPETEGAGDLLDLTVEPGETREVIAVLSRKPGRILGTVKMAEGGAAIGAPVMLRATTPELALRTGGARFSQTGAQGDFRFDGLAPGDYELASSFRLDRTDVQSWPAGAGKMVRVEEGEEGSVVLELAR